MINFKNSKFDWDNNNQEKIESRENITIDMVELIFSDQKVWIMPDIKHSQEEKRFLAIGLCENRRMFVVFTLRTEEHETLIRPISARWMHEKEIKFYEKAFTKS